MDYLLDQLTELRESLTYVYQFIIIIKDMIKDTHEQSDEEIHRKISRTVLSSGHSVSCGAEVHHPSSVTVFIDPKAL